MLVILEMRSIGKLSITEIMRNSSLMINTGNYSLLVDTYYSYCLFRSQALYWKINKFHFKAF